MLKRKTYKNNGKRLCLFTNIVLKILTYPYQSNAPAFTQLTFHESKITLGFKTRPYLERLTGV